jgi:hypothetical protein
MGVFIILAGETLHPCDYPREYESCQLTAILLNQLPLPSIETGAHKLQATQN